MNRLNTIIAAAAIALPLAAFAQAVKAPDQPRTELERKQTTDNGQATKYGGPGTATGDSMSNPQSTTGTGTPPPRKHGLKKPKAGTTPVGDASTYPAPAKDGTPTK